MPAERSSQDLSADARILGMAAQFIRRHGAQRITVVEIAEAAGMSHANVYRYFPSKKALLEEVTADWLRPIEAEARVIAEGPDPAPDKLERILFAIHRSYRDKLEHDPQLFRLLVAAAEADEGVARKHRTKLQGVVQRTIEAGFAQGNFRQTDLRKALALVFDGAHRFLHPTAIALDADTPRPVIDARAARIARLLLQALGSGRY
jgi:AcrR family transcriptional regulator